MVDDYYFSCFFACRMNHAEVRRAARVAARAASGWRRLSWRVSRLGDTIYNLRNLYISTMLKHVYLALCLVCVTRTASGTYDWTEVTTSTTKPSARRVHSSIFYDQQMVMFGIMVVIKTVEFDVATTSGALNLRRAWTIYYWL